MHVGFIRNGAVAIDFVPHYCSVRRSGCVFILLCMRHTVSMLQCSHRGKMHRIVDKWPLHSVNKHNSVVYFQRSMYNFVALARPEYHCKLYLESKRTKINHSLLMWWHNARTQIAFGLLLWLEIFRWVTVWPVEFVPTICWTSERITFCGSTSTDAGRPRMLIGIAFVPPWICTCALLFRFFYHFHKHNKFWHWFLF